MRWCQIVINFAVRTPFSNWFFTKICTKLLYIHAFVHFLDDANKNVPQNSLIQHHFQAVFLRNILQTAVIYIICKQQVTIWQFSSDIKNNFQKIQRLIYFLDSKNCVITLGILSCFQTCCTASEHQCPKADNSTMSYIQRVWQVRKYFPVQCFYNFHGRFGHMRSGIIREENSSPGGEILKRRAKITLR